MTPTVMTVEQEFLADDLNAAVDCVCSGGILVLPTDTVYGIGALASEPASVMRVLAAKGRGRQMPPPVLVGSIDAIDEVAVDIPAVAYSLARAFWPGALTLILQARPDLGWDLGDTFGTIAVRMPDHQATLELLKNTGPLAVTSANTTGNPPAVQIQQAVDYFADNVDLYIDGGPSQGGIASTILNLSDGHPRAVRVGALSLEELSNAVGCHFADVAS